MDYLEKEKRKIHPNDRSNILSKLFFFYVLGLYRKGFRRELEETDVYEVPYHLRAKLLGDRIEKKWEKQKADQNSYFVLLFFLNTYGKPYLLLGLLQLSMDIAETIIPPYALGKFISYFSPGQSDVTINDASCYALILISFHFVQRMYKHNFQLRILWLGMKIRTSFCSLIYRKILKLNISFLEDLSVGKIVTLFTKDADGFEASLDFLNEIWIGFVKIIVVSCILYRRIGVSALIGISTFFISIPLQLYLGTVLSSLKIKMYKRTDRRLQVTQETLSAIKVIKMYAWENKFATKIATARMREINAMYKVFFMKQLISIIGNLNSYIAFYVLIMSYVWLGNNINAETVYFAIATFETLSYCLSVLFPSCVSHTAELMAAVKRFKQILNAGELELRTSPNISKASPTIKLKNAEIIIKNKPLIRDVNLTFEKGLTILTGPVGSGKSTLLKGILQEYKVNHGSCMIGGDISYASQEPWLFPSTIRQNILFGQKYDEERYQKVLRVCALTYDLECLEDGDGTIVEDRGINLSKGQQVRINLARAVYRQCDIYLLDDSLTALDPPVAAYIFEECLNKFLRNKVVVFITHNANYFIVAQNVLSLTNGTIKNAQSFFHTHGDQHLNRNENIEHRKTNRFKDSDQDDSVTNESTKLIPQNKVRRKVYREQKKTGKVNKEVYQKYVKFGGGLIVLFIVSLVFILSQFSVRYTDKLINNWVNLEEKIINFSTNHSSIAEELVKERKTIFYFYSAAITATTVTTLGKVIALFFFTRTASLRIHDKCITSIINATMQFFDTNFIGNVLNRFSKDLMEVDEFLPGGLYSAAETVLTLLGTIILVVSVNVTFLIPTIIFSGIFVALRSLCIPTLRNLKRLESISRSPLIGHLNAALEGLITIRVSKIEKILKDEFSSHHDVFASAMYTYYMSTKAFAFMVDMLCFLFIALIMIRFLLSTDNSLAGDVGLAITQALTMTKALQGGIRIWTELEVRMTLVQRVMEYMEAKQEKKDGLELEEWPQQGRIQYENVSLSYATSLEPILLDVSFIVQPKEHIGIVGRTGAGKSSIISSLFRLYETDGKITIDDVDIKTVSLNILRSKISIIPQDPVLFTGTIRENIDPEEKYTDEDIWKVIEMAHLKTIIPSLDFEITDSGSSFSTGQKQLICIARALVLNNKIVVLDEATATMDSETESFVIRTIEENFKSCTVIIIAHKLRTVLNCDKIMVLDKGKIIEYDQPSTLLQNSNSVFYKMVSKADLQISQC